MQRRQFMKRAAGISAMAQLPFGATGLPAARKDNEKNIKKGDLASNLKLLNQWGERPAAVQRLYEAAYKVLEARRDAAYADLAADSELRRLCADEGRVHLGGPMLGCISSRGAGVWIRTLRPAKVEVRVTVNGRAKIFGPVRSTVENDLSAVVPVTGLRPSTSYPYQVLVDGKIINIPAHAAITTAPDESTPARVRIAFGTCPHRWGLGNHKLWTLIRKRKPTVMLLGGDIAVQDRRNHFGLHRADYLLRDFFGAWQDFSAAVPVCTTWDDHDYFDNDLWGIPKGFSLQDKQGVCDVFRRAWNNPSYGFGDERRGVFLRTRIGPCDVIMVDERYFRTGPKGNGSLLGVYHPFVWNHVERLRFKREGFVGDVGPRRSRADIQIHRKAQDIRCAADFRRPAWRTRIPHPAAFRFQFLRIRSGEPGRQDRPAGNEASMGYTVLWYLRQVRLRRVHCRCHNSRS